MTWAPLSSLLVSGALAFALAGACSPAKQNPPLLPDCDAGIMCGITSGGSVGVGGPQMDGSAACGVIMYRDQVCNACVQAQCCARDATCSNNQDCISLLQCEAACSTSDMACIQACRVKWQNAIADHDNFISCKDSSCGTECAGVDGGATCGVGLFQSLACNTCVSASCCSENRACSNNPECLALLQCTVPCAANDQACIMDCQTLHPSGDTDYRALGQCVQSSCSAQCP